MDADSRRLAGRVALATGASRGIGPAIARRPVAEGARVGLTARRPEALAEAVDALGGPAYAEMVAAGPTRALAPAVRVNAVAPGVVKTGPHGARARAEPHRERGGDG
ncbi:SDR family NAD(P)-dependent oxidoreductase [Micromonospora globbae]|uniref:SDR family NAD(P)-dependent oxidoreductase n=1 Tax=Micromonospora globbae TaxID=1894969 RepID=A0A420F846_9ACTN|nr:SDR family NAD(P)-dependent oxidoreductase [Micromonospora globbae]RKF29120.1 SDR family NAD(P)-dependent oxidoreductase [Micromonospora globbae]